MTIRIGDTVGEYKVIDLAGSGGMGTVYRIEHNITKRIEAMKVLPIGMSSAPEEIQRFEREVHVHARLHHPNIAALYNAVHVGSSIALILEYVEGESLQRKLDHGHLSPRTAAYYAGQVLDALAYAHDQGVVHRDVTPANIIITHDGTAKLTDFGLARASTDSRLTTTGVTVGSAWYMSPEQVRALDELDGRADLYSMGAVLHEMLSGRKLFDVEGSFAVMCAQMETIPQPPSAYRREIPPALDQVVLQALAKDPAARFQSAGEFRKALDVAAAGLPVNLSKPRIPIPPKQVSAKTVASVAAAAAIIAVTSAVLWLPRKARVAKPPAAPAAVVVPVPAPPPLLEPPPEPAPAPAAETRPPEVAPAVAPPVRRSPRPAAAAHPPAKQNLTLKVSGGVVESNSSPPPEQPARIVVESAEPTPPKLEAAPPPVSPTVPAAAVTAAPPEVPPPSPDEAKPQKSGNRFVRALGKLFHKPAKEPEKPKDPDKKD